MTIRQPNVAEGIVAAAVFLAATLVLFGDVLVAGNARVLSHANDDLARIFFAWHRFGFDELRAGNLALWNPHTYGGAPYFGAFQPALLYPPNWLHLVLPRAFALNLGIALHVFLAGLFVYLWTSYRRIHPAACVLAGLIFMFCGAHFLQIYRGHLPNLRSLIWAPLILLAIDGALRTRAHGWILLGAAAVALQILAGHVQYVIYTAIVAGVYASLHALRSDRPLRDGLAVAALYLGGAALAAVQLLAGLAAVTESLRTDLRWEIARTFAFPPENLLTLVLPGLFGDMVTTPYWGRWTLSETSVFIGTAPSLLAVYATVHGDPRVRRLSGTMAMVALVFALGYYTPLFGVLYAYVPTFRSFRGIAKFTFLSSLFLVMLVATGFDHLLKTERAPRWPATAALVAGAGLVVIGAALLLDCRAGTRTWRSILAVVTTFEDEGFRYFVQGRDPRSEQACTTAGASLVIGGGSFLLTAALLFAARRARRFVWAVGILGVVEVMAYARYTRPTFDPVPLQAAEQALQADLERAGDDARVLGPGYAPYLAMGAGADDVWGSDPMILGRYARFVAVTQGWQPDDILTTPGLRTLSPLLGMLRLRYLVRVERGRLSLVTTQLHTLPRALLLPHWTVLPGEEQALAALFDPSFDPERNVLLESDPGLSAGASSDPGSVSVTDVSTDVIEIRADVRTPAVLLLTDTYSAGWRATPLPGSTADTYRVMPANSIFRALPLPPGHHHVRLEYRPTPYVVGAWISALSLAAFAYASLRWWRTRRAPRT